MADEVGLELVCFHATSVMKQNFLYLKLLVARTSEQWANLFSQIEEE